MMTHLQAYLNLTKLEEEIVQFGKIERIDNGEKHDIPQEDERGKYLLEKYRFDDIQEQYRYGYYIAELSLEDQLKSLNDFKLHILHKLKNEREE